MKMPTQMNNKITSNMNKIGAPDKIKPIFDDEVPSEYWEKMEFCHYQYIFNFGSDIYLT